MRYRSNSRGDTVAFGASLAAVLQPGDVIVLSGDLGAGKTALTSGIAHGIGLQDRVTSPTFALVHRYDHGPAVLIHVDAWRLDSASALEDLGLEDVLDPDVVTVVEWGELVSAALPQERCTVHLALGSGEHDRVIDIEWVGDSWRARSDALTQAAAAALTEES